MSGESRWEDNLHHEVSFWKKWLTHPDFELSREKRISSESENLKGLVHLAKNRGSLKSDGKDLIRVLDVGSGPFSALGRSVEKIELVCVDALAEHYNELLKDNGFNEFANIIELKGEELGKKFPPNAFDLVYCSNALDHFDSPELAFREMYNVCAINGAIVITSIENEGERENYSGLHQWNLRANDDGFWLASRSNTINLLDKIGSEFFYSWQYTSKSADMNIFRAIIEKKNLK